MTCGSRWSCEHSRQGRDSGFCFFFFLSIQRVLMPGNARVVCFFEMVGGDHPPTPARMFFFCFFRVHFASFGSRVVVDIAAAFKRGSTKRFSCRVGR